MSLDSKIWTKLAANVCSGEGSWCPPPPPPVPKCGSKTFDIKIGDKKQSIFADRILNTDDVFTIDGVANKTVYVREGCSYTFKFANEPDESGEHILYLTRDYLGGLKLADPVCAQPPGCQSEKNDIPARVLATDPKNDPAKQSITVKVDAAWPAVAYYQCEHHFAMGGPIVKIACRCEDRCTPACPCLCHRSC